MSGQTDQNCATQEGADPEHHGPLDHRPDDPWSGCRPVDQRRGCRYAEKQVVEREGDGQEHTFLCACSEPDAEEQTIERQIDRDAADQAGREPAFHAGLRGAFRESVQPSSPATPNEKPSTARSGARVWSTSGNRSPATAAKTAPAAKC